MGSITLITRDREFRLEQVETLRELVGRRLISPADQVKLDGVANTLTVGEMLARLDAGISPDAAPAARESAEGDRTETEDRTGDRAPTAPSADPWRAWDTDESVEVDDLVSQLLDDVGKREDAPSDPAVGEPDEADTDLWLTQLSQRDVEVPVLPPAEEDELPDIPDASIEVLGDIPRTVPTRPVPRGSGAPRGPATEPAQTSETSGSWAETPGPSGSWAASSGESAAVGSPPTKPRSFVEYVQQKRATTTPLEIHENRAAPMLEREERRRPLVFWPAVVGVLAVLGALANYGVVRSGAERQYPTEAEVRERLRGNPGGLEAVIDEVSPGEAGGETQVPAAATDLHREGRLRSEIPPGVQRFRNVETFKDALFIDLANSGVLVREIRVEALVVAPFDVHRQKPEEVNLELWLLTPEGEEGMDALYKAALVVGHYGAVAHVRIQELVIHVADGDEVWATFLTRGGSATGFYEGKVDLQAFERSMDRVADGDYIDPDLEDAQ